MKSLKLTKRTFGLKEEHKLEVKYNKIIGDITNE